MGISIKYHNNNGSNDIDKMLDDITNEVTSRISDVLDALTRACLQTVVDCRNQPSLDASHRHEPHQPNYIDNTRLLRGSIGFMIYNHGELYMQNFQGEGISEGMTAAQNAASKYNNEIVAVVVAGAYYAMIVESRGYNVITQQCSRLGELFEKNLKIIFKN